MSRTSTTSSTLVSPHILYLPDLAPASPATKKYNNPLECSVHSLPKQLLREFKHVFRGEWRELRPDDFAATKNDREDNEEDDGSINASIDETTPMLLAIPTNQMAREDLVAVGDHIEAEKNRLLNVFIKFAQEVCGNFKSRGHWADFIDPCSGLPMLATHNHNKVYSEVDGMEVLLGYSTYNAGFCKILTHPQWGSAVYPATIFAYAPLGLAKELLRNYRTFQ